MTRSKLSEELGRKFTTPIPIFLAANKTALKFELKPYLQPFERELAIRELKILAGGKASVTATDGYYLVVTKKSGEFFRQRLTYWQRVGRDYLEPTTQKLLELTQGGLADVNGREELHRVRRLRYGPHDLHEYRGKFFPQLVRSLMNISGVADGGVVLDPMCGSGTTTCEALAAGHSALGADLNPLSVLIARVKSGIILESPEAFSRLILEYRGKFILNEAGKPEELWSPGDLEYLRRWFDPEALRDLAAVLREVKRVKRPIYRDFFLVCLSNIIRSVSWQKSADLRVRKEVTEYDRGAAVARFREEVERQVYRISPYLAVLPRVAARRVLDIRKGNAIDIASVFPEYRGKVDVLITSPPYATALPYLDTDRLSLIILGLLPRNQHRETEESMIGTREVTERQRRETWTYYSKRKGELPSSVSDLIGQIADVNHAVGVGFRRRNLPALLGRYFLGMLDAMRSSRVLMAKRGRGFYVVGNNSSTVNGVKIEIPTDKFLMDIATAAGWVADEAIPMELLVSRDIFKENRGSSETVLSLKA